MAAIREILREDVRSNLHFRLVLIWLLWAIRRRLRLLPLILARIPIRVVSWCRLGQVSRVGHGVDRGGGWRRLHRIQEVAAHIVHRFLGVVGILWASFCGILAEIIPQLVRLTEVDLLLGRIANFSNGASLEFCPLELRAWIAEGVINLGNALFLAAGVDILVVDEMFRQRLCIL